MNVTFKSQRRQCPVSIITVPPDVNKWIASLKLEFSKPQMKNLTDLASGIILSTGKRTISHMKRTLLSSRHVSSYTRFLNQSPWDSHQLKQRRLQEIYESITSRRQNMPYKKPTVGFLAIDDTGCKKHISTQKMEGLEFHYDHNEKRKLWSHKIVSSYIISQDVSLTGDFKIYLRKEHFQENNVEFKSKIDLACELISEHQPTDGKVYVMGDSWYTNNPIIETCHNRGFYYIGCAKSNANIFPVGIKVSIKDFAARLEQSMLHSVTVDDTKYKAYVYEGPISQIDHAKVILLWKKDYDPEVAPFVLVCTDLELDPVTVILYYSQRWQIEIGYRNLKEGLGFDQYQLHSLKAIINFWEIQFLVYAYLELRRLSLNLDTIGQVMEYERKDALRRIVIFAHEKGNQQKPIIDALNELNLAI